MGQNELLISRHEGGIMTIKYEKGVNLFKNQR